MDKGGIILRRKLPIFYSALMLTGVLMLVCKHNEWILCMLVGCLMQLYTAFRIPQEMEKEGELTIDKVRASERNVSLLTDCSASAAEAQRS